MTVRSAILSGLGAILLGSVSAIAADLNPDKGGSIKDHGYAPAHVRTMPAIYLRGDFGWANNDLGSIYEPPVYDLSQTAISRNYTYGAGIGAYFSKHVRGDFTIDWRGNSDVRGSLLDGAATVEGERSFSTRNLVGLFNLYYDFDVRSHFTPYIGVGLGFARNTTSAGSIAIVTTPADPCDVSNPVPTTCAADFNGASKWSAAGALMAGFSAKLHDRLHLDAGYRFLYMGDARTGDVAITRTPVAVGAPTNSSGLTVNELSAHELRVGVRWDIK